MAPIRCAWVRFADRITFDYATQVPGSLHSQHAFAWPCFGPRPPDSASPPRPCGRVDLASVDNLARPARAVAAATVNQYRNGTIRNLAIFVYSTHSAPYLLAQRCSS